MDVLSGPLQLNQFETRRRNRATVAALRFFGLGLFLVFFSGCAAAEDWVRLSRLFGGAVTAPDTATEPVAIITNAPADDSTDASMLALISGDGVSSYLYKIGDAATLDCADASGYSAPRATAQVINDSIDDKMGALAICVLGDDGAGHRQNVANATRYVWTRTWNPKIFVESPGRVASSGLSVTVHLHAPAEFTEVYITNVSTCLSGGAWQARTDSKPWTLPVGSNGSTATVYARFRTAGGKLSACLSRDVFLALPVASTSCVAPTATTAFSGTLVDSGGTTGDYSSSEDCSLTVTSSYPVTFTFTSFDIENGYDFMTFYNGTAVPANELASYTGSALPAPVTNTGTTIVNFKSDGSVEQAGYQLTWDVPATNLVSAVKINSDDVSTTTTAVTLTILNSVGLKEMYITNDGTCAAGGSWEPYAYSKAWTLTAGNGTKTVGVKFRDWVGHETSCESDTILMYSGAPTATLAGTPANGDGSNSLAVTVAGTDVVKYKYKLGVASSTDCAVAAGYSATAANIATLITSSLTSYSSVLMKLCVVGINPIGTAQAFASATSYTWTRQVPLFFEVSESGRWVTEADQNIVFTIEASGGGTAATPTTIDYDLFGELVPELGLTSGQVVLPAGQSSVNVTIPILMNVAADVDKRLSLGISKVSGSHKIGVQALSTMTVRDAQRAATGAVVDIGPNSTCAILSAGGALMCTGSVGGITEATGVYSHGFSRIAPGVSFKSIVVDGHTHSCALSAADQLYCWGWNFDGQLGLGDRVDRSTPTMVPGLTWKQVYSTYSWNDVCGIDSNDDLYCWGDKDYSYGLNGTGTVADALSPTLIDSGNKYKTMSLSHYTACAITMGNKLKCWGDNLYGQIGDGTTTNRYTPVAIDPGRDYASVFVDEFRACAIAMNGDLYCWGENNMGSVPTLVDSAHDYTSLAMKRSLSCGLADGGKLFCWGDDYNNDLGFGSNTTTPVDVDPGTTYLQVAASTNPDMFCALRSDNRVKCFGDVTGEGGDTDKSFRPKTPTVWDTDTFTVIRPINNGICGITSSGYAKCLSKGGYLQAYSPDAPVIDTRTGAVLMGSSVRYGLVQDRCALDTSGYLRCWGNKQLEADLETNYLRSNPIIEASNLQFKTLSVGYRGSCGIRLSDDTLWCWGENTGNGTSAPQSAPVAVDAPTTYKLVSVGDSNSCAITSTDDLKCWGDNSDGTLGLGDTNPRLTPTLVGATKYSQVSVSSTFACGITAANALNCWGANTYGIGDGTSSSSVPAPIAAPTTFTRVAITGGSTACAIRASDSRVMCWGYGSTIGDGATSTRAAPVVTSDTAAYTELYGALNSSTSGGGTMCGKAINGGVFDVKCWGQYQFPFKRNPTTVYTGTVKSVAIAYRESVLIVNGASDLYYAGSAMDVPGRVQRMKRFEFIQGLVDR